MIFFIDFILKFQKRFYESDLLDQEKERQEHLLLEMVYFTSTICPFLVVHNKILMRQ